ncbi:MAG TPA: methylated-DNA--[protein]-cysteine S-methyltransferase [Candidatus Limnocylindrales bacterium]|nr:methylated-DNA--[protein]-cysteine S-methyltransferase [Candidatus Limnocylindrales bacterium]
MLELASYNVETPHGVFLVLFSRIGIHEIYFPGSRPDHEYPQGDLPWPRFKEDLNRYFAGEAINWNPYPLDCTGYRLFTSRLLDEVRRIPHGLVCTYRDVAARAGSPLAWRAAGQALKANRHPIVVPCHRVISSGGGLGGFSGPPGWKKMLLDLEGAPVK